MFGVACSYWLWVRGPRLALPLACTYAVGEVLCCLASERLLLSLLLTAPCTPVLWDV